MPTPTMPRWWGSLGIMWRMTAFRRGRESRKSSWQQGHKQLKATRRVRPCCAHLRKIIYKKKPRAINVDKNYSEAVQKRINGLVSMLLGMGSYKPPGILTDALKPEWKQSCRRIAEKKFKTRRRPPLTVL
jgi:hypothetical protein